MRSCQYVWVFLCLGLLPASRPLATAESLFKNPTIAVTPANLDFGAVKTNSAATNTFVVENVGGGRLIGKASVPAPFKILSGESYNLRRNEAQVITLRYVPSGASSDTQTVTFTGAGGASSTVVGKLAPSPRRKRS
jgi:hypothetical protein